MLELSILLLTLSALTYITKSNIVNESNENVFNTEKLVYTNYLQLKNSLIK